MTGSLVTFSSSPLLPAFPQPVPIWEEFQFGASQTILKGTLVAQKVSDGKLYPYVASTFVATPATPVFTAAGAGGAWPATTYSVAISYVNPQGETLPCPAVFLTLTAGQNIRVPAIATIDATVTTVRVYVNGFLAKEIAVAAQAIVQTDIANFSTTLAGLAQKSISTATKITDGTQIPIGIMSCDITTDATGRVSPGANTPGEFGQTYIGAPVYLRGYFLVADLVGLDANAVALMNARYVLTTVLSIG